ncbi:hypothetical protein B0T13DRAFT_398750, partial [Neurospora crassa]
GHFIGFNDFYGRIIFIKNPYTNKIIRVSAVSFLKEDLANYEDLIRSSNSNIVEYYTIFSN